MALAVLCQLSQTAILCRLLLTYRGWMPEREKLSGGAGWRGSSLVYPLLSLPTCHAADITACFSRHSSVYDSIIPWVKRGEQMSPAGSI